MCVVCYSCVVVVVVVDFPFIFFVCFTLSWFSLKMRLSWHRFLWMRWKKVQNFKSHKLLDTHCHQTFMQTPIDCVHTFGVRYVFFLYSVVPPYASHPNCPLLRTITIWCDIFLCNVLVFRVLFFNNMMSSTSKSQLCMIQLKLTGRSGKRHCYECIFICIYSYNIFNNLTI